MPQSGLALRSSSTMVCSARLSAIETKSAGPLRLTWRCSTSPKSRRSRGAALRTARCMTVMRPEWETIRSRLVRPLHIFPAVRIDDDPGAAADVRRHHHPDAIVEHCRLVAGRGGLAFDHRVGI